MSAIGNLAAGVAAIIFAAVLAVADAAVVQAVEAEGVDVGKLGDDLGQHVDEEVAVGAQQAEHAAVRELFA